MSTGFSPLVALCQHPPPPSFTKASASVFSKLSPLCVLLPSATEATQCKPSPLSPSEAARCTPRPAPPQASADPCLPFFVSFSVQHYSLTAAPYSLQDELNCMLTGTQPDSPGHELSHPGPVALSDVRSDRHLVSCLSCPTAVHTDPFSPS